MAQCSFCLKLFASKRYLTTHLHQSPQCLSALTNRGIVPSHRTLDVAIVPSLTGDSHATHDVIVAQPPVPLNALGDLVLLDGENSSSSDDFQFISEMDDNASTVPADLHGTTSTSAEPSLLPDDAHLVANNLQTIRPNESFNVPDFADDKDIPRLKIITAVRDCGAPMKLVGIISKIVREESQLGRLDVNRLTTHQTGMRRIQKMFPNVPLPKPVTISHERSVHEMRTGAERPSLTFPMFSFLGQLTDLLNDHVFSD